MTHVLHGADISEWRHNFPVMGVGQACLAPIFVRVIEEINSS